MNSASPFVANAKHFVLSTFTELTFWKRWLVRLALIGLVAGAIAFGISLAKGGEVGDWSNFGLRSGAGYLLGFAAGACVRLFLKVSVMLAVIAAAGTWALVQLGLVHPPWHSLAEIQAAFSLEASASASWLDTFFKSHLPHSAASAVGVFSGVTQRPRMPEAEQAESA